MSDFRDIQLRRLGVRVVVVITGVVTVVVEGHVGGRGTLQWWYDAKLVCLLFVYLV